MYQLCNPKKQFESLYITCASYNHTLQVVSYNIHPMMVPAISIIHRGLCECWLSYFLIGNALIIWELIKKLQDLFWKSEKAGKSHYKVLNIWPSSRNLVCNMNPFCIDNERIKWKFILNILKAPPKVVLCCHASLLILCFRGVSITEKLKQNSFCRQP